MDNYSSALLQQALDPTKPIAEQIRSLKDKAIELPAWGGAKGLVKEYDPNQHPVMDKAIYPDVLGADGRLEKVSRITYALQKLAVKRMSELTCGIPVKRIYKPKDDGQARVANYLEAIYKRNRIDSINIERCNMLYAACEVMTFWYAVEEQNNYYGFTSPIKLRCRNFSPFKGDALYPLFDELGDLQALSIESKRKAGGIETTYFDTYTASRHLMWSSAGSEDWALQLDEPIALGKIPAIYSCRPAPIWEDTSGIVSEMEWAMSRNGNYLRKNSKPLFVVLADAQISYGDEKDEKSEFRSVLQYPKGSTAQYVTWEQAVENLRFYIAELRQSFFTQLQLPDWSYESMKAVPMSGESRKQLFIDAMLKVQDESGVLIEAFDREINVLKAFLKTMLPTSEHGYIDALQVDNEITPYTITDERDTIANLTTANGGKALISQRESVELLGWSNDVEKTMSELSGEEDRTDLF